MGPIGKAGMPTVHLGSRIRMMTPWNRDGLYSELRVRKLIFCRFKSQPRLTVATQFWILIEATASSGSVAGIGDWGTMASCGGNGVVEPAAFGWGDWAGMATACCGDWLGVLLTRC